MDTNPTTSAHSPEDIIHLRLYIAGMTQRSKEAIDNIHRICDEHCPGQVDVEVIDLLENPQLSEDDQIFAVPTVVKRLPPPLRKVVGDLSDALKTLVGLDIRSSKPSNK